MKINFSMNTLRDFKPALSGVLKFGLIASLFLSLSIYHIQPFTLNFTYADEYDDLGSPDSFAGGDISSDDSSSDYSGDSGSDDSSSDDSDGPTFAGGDILPPASGGSSDSSGSSPDSSAGGDILPPSSGGSSSAPDSFAGSDILPSAPDSSAGADVLPSAPDSFAGADILPAAPDSFAGADILPAAPDTTIAVSTPPTDEEPGEPTEPVPPVPPTPPTPPVTPPTPPVVPPTPPPVTPGGGTTGGGSTPSGTVVAGGVSSGGGVTLYANPGSGTLAAVSLSQIPYTGFDLGPIGTATFWALLIAWSGWLSYFLVMQGGMAKISGALAFLGSVAARPRASSIAVESHDVPSNLPTGDEAPRHSFEVPVHAPVLEENESAALRNLLDTIERTAHGKGALISREGASMIAGLSDERAEEAIPLLDKLIVAARERFPREDGWILLNGERIATLMPVRNVAQGGEKVSTTLSTATTLLHWIADGEEEKLFMAMRRLKVQGYDLRTLMTQALSAVDALYRSRIDRTPADEALSQKFSSWTERELEELVDALAISIDYTYNSPHVALKLSLVRALSVASAKSGSKERIAESKPSYIANL